MGEFTVINILNRSATLFPEKRVIYGNKSITYKNLFNNVLKLSKSMNEIGISKGTIIAVADYNSIEFMELLFASSLNRSIVYPVNIKLPWNMAMETIKESNAEYVFASDDFINAGIFKGFDNKHAISLNNENNNYIKFDEMLKGNFYNGKTPEGNDNYSILFTSGTTGKPKEVMYTNEKTVNGALSILYQLGLFNTPASLSSKDNILSLIPFYHIWSWGSAFHAAYIGSNYIITGKYNVYNILNAIKENNVTWINAVPTMIYDLLSHDDKNILNGIKVLIGGSPISKGIAEKLIAKGIKFSTIYGGTDMLATSISLGDINEHESLRSITHPVPMVNANVKDNNGNILENGKLGELYVNAPWLPGKYLNKSNNNEYNNGWFKTGDVAIITENGGIKILDRVKDVIKSGGEWIPTSIIESIISEYPGIENVAVVAKNDEKWGERPVAWIKASKKIEIEKLKNFMESQASKGNINKWWIPAEFINIEEMPLTSTGKIDKAKLREIKK